MENRGTAFGPGVIVLDDTSFIRCIFNRSTLVYRGGPPPTLVECTFNEVDWQFEGPAANTLALLRAIYHGMGSGGRMLVEETFDNIRVPPDES